ncbi:MAG: DNA-binding protein WhiA [Synergistaceae bacterium]|nr:DNA-binding protein WhiA [Synergistaceae bacterium]
MDKDLWLAKIWDEWLSSPVKSHTYADAETSGLLLGMRHNHSTFTTNRLRAARRLTGPGKFPLWPLTSYSQKFTLNISMTTRPGRKASVKFSVIPGLLTALRSPQKSPLIWPWLKGLWGSAGGLYFPKSGYYLTLIVSDPEISRTTRGVLAKTGLAWSEHRNEFTLRNHDDIMTFLYNIGIESGALDFEGRTLIRSARNKANLERNYDAANIARSVRAAGEQSRLAEKIVSSGMIEALPENLREVVSMRLEYPDASLEELGGKLNPPVSKSTVNYRWNKIRRLIEG